MHSTFFRPAQQLTYSTQPFVPVRSSPPPEKAVYVEVQMDQHSPQDQSGECDEERQEGEEWYEEGAEQEDEEAEEQEEQQYEVSQANIASVMFLPTVILTGILEARAGGEMGREVPKESAFLSSRGR